MGVSVLQSIYNVLHVSSSVGRVLCFGDLVKFLTREVIIPGSSLANVILKYSGRMKSRLNPIFCVLQQ